MQTRGIATVALACALVGACKKESKPEAPAGKTQAAPPQAAERPVGMSDPFQHLSPEAQKALERGYKAAKAKKHDEAVEAFRAVVAAAPDYTPARWQLVRALALAGKLAEVPAAWDELVVREPIGWPEKLERAKDLAPLRASAEGQKLVAETAKARAAYADGLKAGFFFVARARAASEPKLDGKGDGPLELHQEVYHYDPQKKRFRRLTDSDGHAFALHPSPDGKSLLVLVAPMLHREGTKAALPHTPSGEPSGGSREAFVDPKVALVDLATLDQVGPFPHAGRYDQVVLGSNAGGQPLFTFTVSTGASETFTVDTARTGLAPLTGSPVMPAGGETRAWPDQVAHVAGRTAAEVGGVQLTDGANQFTITPSGAPSQPITVTAARPIAQSSLDWSPGHVRLTYAGKLDACRILKSGGNEKNELFVYDLPRRSAVRVAQSVSHFQTLWLDDDRLVYEGGVGKDGKLHLYAFTAHADEALPTRHGAGLYGVPQLACEQAETGVDEDLGGGAESEDEGD